MNLPPNNGMQPDKIVRYARNFAADAKRYASKEENP